jgi:hypothetical protein
MCFGRSIFHKQAQNFRPFRFHDLRHVHAVNWLKCGRSIHVLQQRLGHTSVKTTEMYLAYLTPEQKQTLMFARLQQAQNQALEQWSRLGKTTIKPWKWGNNLKQEMTRTEGCKPKVGVQSSQPAPSPLSSPWMP